ncbi:MAG: energy transducer TonB [Burkholderiaceae bacterium]|nr:energy transducer TonB [Burkholderiaceae bacterium]
MRLLAIVCSLFLAACAATSRYPHAVPAASGTLMNAAAYNKEISLQGLSYYCANNECNELPRLITGYAPVYPPALRSAGITGQATIVFTIDEQGSVIDPRVESATATEFSDASIQALRTWRFAPAALNGKPVRITPHQLFPFELR